MQFQVPQFIETEDKIIGPLTLHQFGYVAGAGAISFLLYFTVQTWLWVIATIFLAGIAATLAFIKINGRPLIHVALSALNFYWRPQMYVWQPTRTGREKSGGSNRLTAGGSTGPMSKTAEPREIARGNSIYKAWQNLQTGTKMSSQQIFGKTKERYQAFRRLTGERAIAKRVDYR